MNAPQLLKTNKAKARRGQANSRTLRRSRQGNDRLRICPDKPLAVIETRVNRCRICAGSRLSSSAQIASALNRRRANAYANRCSSNKVSEITCVNNSKCRERLPASK